VPPSFCTRSIVWSMVDEDVVNPTAWPWNRAVQQSAGNALGVGRSGLDAEVVHSRVTDALISVRLDCVFAPERSAYVWLIAGDGGAVSGGVMQ
jgi:hypothetical protein